MTANVSLSYCDSLRVKGHSLKERNVLGNVLIVDHHVKKIYINIYTHLFTRTVRKAL